MKNTGVLLILVLGILLAASLNALAAWDGQPCTTWRDCYNQVREGTGKYCNVTDPTHQILENWTHFGECIGGICVDKPGPRAYWVTCDKPGSSGNAINTTCYNGGTYTFKNTCWHGACTAYNIQPQLVPSAGCDRCTACKSDATRMEPASSFTKYNFAFYNDYDEYATDNGTYIVPPNTTMDLIGISSVRFICGNSGPFNQSSNLAVWVYNATSGTKLAMGFNDLEIDSTLNRSNVIGDSSDTCGALISNVFETVIGTNGTPVHKTTKIENIYDFTQPSKYTVFIDIIAAYCTPIDADHRPITQNYVCPWLGGTSRANLCIDTDNKSADGWVPKENLTILVPYPDINIVAPANELDPKPVTIKKTWTITNTGTGKVNFSITSDCGGWACAFDGYNAGDPIPPLEENEAYTITMNITIDLSGSPKHNVGIIVTYDEGYGLKSIPPQTKTSYIQFGVSYIT
jgi:hypothetical protein